MIRIFLSGEGKTDYGILGSDGRWKEGPVQRYFHKIIPDSAIEIIPFDRKAEKGNKRLRFQGRRGLKGHAFEAYILATEAKANGCQIAAFYVDADRAGKTERECRQHYEELKKSILEGIHSVPQMSGIAIVPVKMIESWLMGDAGAFDRLYGAPARKPDFPQKPELDWGDPKDTESNFPKNRVKRILACYYQTPNLQTFCDIADEAELNRLRSSCPISFEDFYQQCKRIFALNEQDG